MWLDACTSDCDNLWRNLGVDNGIPLKLTPVDACYNTVCSRFLVRIEQFSVYQMLLLLRSAETVITKRDTLCAFVARIRHHRHLRSASDYEAPR